MFSIKRRRSLGFILVAVLLSTTANASWLQGNIDWLEVEPNTYRVYLVSPVVGSACTATTVDWSYTDTNYMKQLLAALMSAQAREKPIRWWDCGCNSTNTSLAACAVMTK